MITQRSVLGFFRRVFWLRSRVGLCRVPSRTLLYPGLRFRDLGSLAVTWQSIGSHILKGFSSFCQSVAVTWSVTCPSFCRSVAVTWQSLVSHMLKGFPSLCQSVAVRWHSLVSHMLKAFPSFCQSLVSHRSKGTGRLL